ncbi:hypothetical protein LUZ60_001278 [Juncus effusus]|nr:hypothetical protein LUZ60_001278 [Juncus effusus]
MEEIAAKMVSVKKEGRPKSELRELITQMSLLFITLRQVNRAILLEEDKVKSETERAKAPVDFTTLQLHNLMYEKNHYLNAIKACKDFHSKFPEIDLVPESDFFANAPESIKGKSLASDPSHDLMLKRLNFELFQRKELCKKNEKLEQRKKSLTETISDKKRFLSNLPSQLKSLKKASLPVQQQLGISHSKKLKQFHSADLLPAPLYIIFSQLLAQKEAFGERIEMEIVGSTKEALSFLHQQSNKETGQISNEEDLMEEEEDGQRRRTRSKKDSNKQTGFNNKEGINKIHPLKIIMNIFDDSRENAVKLIALRFEYLVKLNVVCVGIEGDETSNKDILCNLFPDDSGFDLPHSTAKLKGGDSLKIGEMNTRPYKWAQHLAGVDFLPDLPPSSEMKSDESMKNADVASSLAVYRRQNRVQSVLQRIRSRKLAHLALKEQLDSLSKLKWPALNYENAPWASYTSSSILYSWSQVGPTSADSASGSNPFLLEASDRRSITTTHWEEGESNREDGELPMANPVTGQNRPVREKTPTSPPPGGSEADPAEFSRSLSMISKSGPRFKKGIDLNVVRGEDDDEDEMMVLYSDSELEGPVMDEMERDNGPVGSVEAWEDCGLREYKLVLRQSLGNNEILKLEAKVKVSVEYPLRPPLVKLSLHPEGSHGSKYHNELRSMEAEVNLHILKVIPLECANYTLAHQVKYLVMLFDLYFSEPDERKKIMALVGEPVSGNLRARFVRGRDRRMSVYWENTYQ